MTGKLIVSDVRSFLGDRPELSSTGNLIFEDEEILEAVNTCRDWLIRALWLQPRSPEQPFQIALTKCVKTVTIASGANLPTDFWKVICAQKAGAYVPVETDNRSFSWAGLGEAASDHAYIAGGLIYGDIDTLIYVSVPATKIANTNTTLADFDDSFFECLELVACIALLGKRQRGSLDAMLFLAKEVARSMSTLT